MPLNCQIKIRQIFFCMRVRMAIPYHTAKFESKNSVKNIVWGQTAKFNDHQYFRLCGKRGHGFYYIGAWVLEHTA